jgi:DNA-binding SARP family transcriptional activator
VGRELTTSSRGAVAAARQEILLVMLLLRANNVVPVDRLIGCPLWANHPPRTAKSQVMTRHLGGYGSS